LTLALRDDDSRVQCAALKSITRLNPENSIDVIRALIPTAGGLLMITCLEILASLGDDAALSLVETVLDNEDEELVKFALSILSCYDAQRIVRNAERLIGHPHSGIRYDTAMALAALSGQRPLTILKAALETEESSLVKNLMERLVKGIA